MKSFTTHLFIASLLILNTLQLCNPPYWQTQKQIIKINELDAASNQTNITLNSISITTGTATKTHWNINNILGNSSGLSSNVTVTSTNNTINVGNYLVVVTLHMKVQKSKTKIQYNGTAEVEIKINTSYSKQIVDSQNQISFKFISLNYSHTVSEIKYSPSISSSDKQTFDTLIRNNVTAEALQFIDQKLRPSVKEQVQSQKIKKTFGSSYEYRFNNYSTVYMMNLQQIQVFNKTGLATGYNASVQGTSTCAADSKPYDENSAEASFFSLEFCQSFLQNNIKNNSDWQKKTINNTYISNIFNFDMKDLTPIVPDAVKTYPGLFVKVFANCSIIPTNNTLQVDPIHNRFQVNVLWNCTMYRVGDNPLFGFAAHFSYWTSISQKNTSLIHNISAVQLIGVVYQKIDFDIQNQDTATQYIKSILGNFAYQSISGTNFYQPYRTNPKITLTKKYLKINDASKVYPYNQVEIQI